MLKTLFIKLKLKKIGIWIYFTDIVSFENVSISKQNPCLFFIRSTFIRPV